MPLEVNLQSVRRAISGSPLRSYLRRARTFARAHGLGRLTPAEKDLRYNRLLVTILEQVLQPTSNCVDVGAHAGDVLREIVRLAPSGAHHAIEPLPDYARKLERTFPGVRVLEIALGSTNETTRFRHVLSAPASSGFVRQQWDTYEEEVKTIDVEVRRLDDVLPADVAVSFLKVDVEGAEGEVFQGALETLRRHQPYVAFELGSDPEAVFNVLVEEAGLRVSLLDEWLARRPPMDRETFLIECRTTRNFFFLAHPEEAPRSSGWPWWRRQLHQVFRPR